MNIHIYEGEVHLLQEELDSFLDAAQKLQITGLLSIQEDVIENGNDYSATSKSESNCREGVDKEAEEIKFEVSGIENQNMKIRNKTVVAVSGHDQNEVNKKVREIILKENDYFKCTACGKMSKDRRNMRRHVEIHIEGLSYECQVCNNTFR